MTDNIERARKLLAAATSGQWSVEPHGETTALYAGRCNDFRNGKHGMRLLNLDDGDHNFAANVELIVSAPELLQALCDEITAMKAQKLTTCPECLGAGEHVAGRVCYPCRKCSGFGVVLK